MVKGADRVKASLRRVERELSKQTRPATRAGARIVRDEARKVARSKGVRAARARKIVTRDRRSQPTTEIGYRIDQKKNSGFLFRFYERGVQSHAIVVKRVSDRTGKFKRSLFATRGRLAGKFLGKKVRHPGLTKRPILPPAFQAKKDEAGREVARVYREALQKGARGGA